MGLRTVLTRLVRLPMFTGLTVVTLGLGLGANSAIFSVIEGVLLRPLPFPESQQLVTVNHAAPGVNIPDAGIATFLYLTYRDENRVFQDVGMWNADSDSVTGLSQPEEVTSVNVTDGILTMLGVTPMYGRVFTHGDDSPGSPENVILTYGYWKSRFGGDPDAVGRPLLINGKPHEIIGILPASFRFLDRSPAILLPLRVDRNRVRLGGFGYTGMARLKPGVTVDQASADVARMIPLALQRFPPFPGFSVKMFEESRLSPLMKPLRERLTGDISTQSTVLLIACANVANLLLVRVEGRQHELAVRAALGATRGQLARELLLESVTLGLLGGLLGLALAGFALRVLISLAPANLPRVDEIRIDGGVLLFTLAISLLAGVLFGAIPILKYTGAQLNTALRSEGRSVSISKERHRARSTLVVVQVALTLMLLIGAGLMIRTFQALRHVQPGFSQPEEVLTLRISIPTAAVKEPDAVLRMEQNIVDKIATIAGVTSIGLTTKVPTVAGGQRDPIFAEDHVYAETQIPPVRLFKYVSPGLLKTLGNTLIAGRDFTWVDMTEKRPVAMISENLARELWRDPRAAIGKRFRETLKSPWRDVIGVVADERSDGLDQPPPTTVYWPLLTEHFEGGETNIVRGLVYMIRSARAGTPGLLTEVSQAVWSVNPDLPLADVRTLREVYDKSLARTSFTLVMLAIAGGMALLLGIAGIYGVIAYSVSQRTREIGIRLALGAQHAEVTRMFVRHGALLAALGIALGLTGALLLTRLMTRILFDVSPLDPLTYVAVSAGLAFAAILASYIPALRATAVDPVKALRH